MSNVVDIAQARVKPKTVNRQYKRHKYTVTFTPATKKWKWDVEIVSTTHITGDADTEVKAYRAAEKQIDSVLKIQGKGAA